MWSNFRANTTFVGMGMEDLVVLQAFSPTVTVHLFSHIDELYPKPLCLSLSVKSRINRVNIVGSGVDCSNFFGELVGLALVFAGRYFPRVQVEPRSPSPSG